MLDSRINIRCSIEEKKELQIIASRFNLTLTDMMLNLAWTFKDLADKVENTTVLEDDVFDFLYHSINANSIDGV